MDGYPFSSQFFRWGGKGSYRHWNSKGTIRFPSAVLILLTLAIPDHFQGLCDASFSRLFLPRIGHPFNVFLFMGIVEFFPVGPGLIVLTQNTLKFRRNG